MSLCKEAIPTKINHPGMRKWYKQQLNRYHRRRAKFDPENAPTQKRYHGYS